MMPTSWPPAARHLLPEDAARATLLGRAWSPAAGGPVVITVRGDDVIDITATFPTSRAASESDAPADAVASASGSVLTSFADLVANTPIEVRDPQRPWLLSPIDLQVIKAAGVTFPMSMIERVIEERARGDKDGAAAIRAEIDGVLGGSLADLKPGSPEAAALKALLVERGWWSQYLEVGIGPDAEVFTKAPVLSSIGAAADIGVYSGSDWSNPEPELVMIVSSTGRIVGATLGNDVNLRDIEGRSALLLGKAKDNNASAAIGPFIRLFDAHYGLDQVRTAFVTLDVVGEDGYHLQGTSAMAQISRDPEDLVSQVIGAHHQYPDGFVLYLGTLFAPVEDRGELGRGFTHVRGDVVRIAEPHLGALVNRVSASEDVEPWTFGIDALYRSLAERGLLS